MDGDILFWIGRIFFAALFIGSGIGHFTQMGAMSQYAESKGLPAPKAAVALTGLMLLAGGLSILLWSYVVVGTWLLIVFLGVAAIKMHAFWKIDDPMEAQTEQAQFMKNMALLGACLIFYLIAAGGGQLPN
jgi:uncharacterized membrane protein YphA (DoxX/SURF4 family)